MITRKRIVLILTTTFVFCTHYLMTTDKRLEPPNEEYFLYVDESILKTDTHIQSSPSTALESSLLLKTTISTIKSTIISTTVTELTPSKVPSTTPLQNTTTPLQITTTPLQNTTTPLQNTTTPLQNTTTAWQNTTERRRTIIFLETSNKTYLDCRQACAVESAAKHNPNMNVTLFHVSEELNFTNTLIDILAEMPNVEFTHLPLDDFMDDSPLKYWYHAGKWNESRYKISHLSDALRFLTLWKFGGIYLDLDVVVLKSLDDLVNCSGFQHKNDMAAGVLAFDKQHPFMYKCLLELNATYDKNQWSANGPYLIARVLMRECAGIDNLTQVSREKCKGVMVYPPDAFYAIYYPSWRLFFYSNNANSTMQKWKDSYLIHLWNQMSMKTPIKIGSGQPYELAAIEHCPEVHAMCAKNGSF